MTPDHVIRTKPRPLILPAPEAGKLDAFAKAARRAVEKYQSRLPTAISPATTPRRRRRKPRSMPCRASSWCRVSACSAPASRAEDARIAADIAETAISVVSAVEAGSRFESISEADQFDIEYWSLEQAKLGKRADKPLQGQVAVITGGAGTLGFAIASAFRRAGAEVALLDRDARVEAAAQKLKGLGVVCDVTSRAALEAAFDEGGRSLWRR